MAKSKTLSKNVASKSTTLKLPSTYLCKVPSNTQLITYCPFLNVLSFVMGNTDVPISFAGGHAQVVDFPPVLMTFALDAMADDVSKQSQIILDNDETYMSRDDRQGHNGTEVEERGITRLYLLNRKSLSSGLLRAVVYPFGNVFPDGSICWPNDGHRIIDYNPYNLGKIMSVFYGSTFTTHELTDAFYEVLTDLDKSGRGKKRDTVVLPGFQYVSPLTKEVCKFSEKEFEDLCDAIEARADELLSTYKALNVTPQKISRTKVLADPTLLPVVQLLEFEHLVVSLRRYMEQLADNAQGYEDEPYETLSDWVGRLSDEESKLDNGTSDFPQTVVDAVVKPLSAKFTEQFKAADHFTARWYPPGDSDISLAVVEQNFVEGFKQSDKVMNNLDEFNPIGIMAKSSKTARSVAISDFLLVIPEGDFDSCALSAQGLATTETDLVVPLRFDPATKLLIPLPDDDSVQFKSLTLVSDGMEVNV